MTEQTTRGGRIVRPGFYRAPDGSGVAYANQVKNQNPAEACVFCPESLEERGVEILERIGSMACKFAVIQGTPQYKHFDAQKVVEHRLIIPEDHVESLRHLGKRAQDTLTDYLNGQEELYDNRDDGVSFQSYTRTAQNPSKSVGHVHTHLFGLALQPVSTFSYAIEKGVTRLEFADLSPEEIAEIIASRGA